MHYFIDVKLSPDSIAESNFSKNFWSWPKHVANAGCDCITMMLVMVIEV